MPPLLAQSLKQIFDVEYGLSGNNSQELAIDFDVRLLVIKHHF
jgi:hypothetical protein